MTMETVRLSFVKKEFLVKHSDTLHLVERSSVFSLYRFATSHIYTAPWALQIKPLAYKLTKDQQFPNTSTYKLENPQTHPLNS